MIYFSFIDITGKLNVIEIILEHNFMRQKCLKDLCELTFLQDFPKTFTERRIIIDKYIHSTRMINEQRNRLIAFIFIFRTENIFQTTFNNHTQ